MRWSTLAGWLLVALGTIGFLSVADDFRHVGELLGVASLLVVGVLLVIAGSAVSRSRRAAAFWLAGTIAIGAAVGAAIDDMPVGTGGGLIVGLLLAAVVGLRRERASA